MRHAIAFLLLSTAIGAFGAVDSTSAFSFTSASAVVPENDLSITLTVLRTGDLTVPASVQYTTVDGSASSVPSGGTGGSSPSSPADYVPAAGTLSFGTGQDSATISVSIDDDSIVEGPETFQVQLGTTGGNGVLGSPSTVTVTITDNDGAGTATSGSATAGGTATAGAATSGSTLGNSSNHDHCGHGAAAPLGAGLALMAMARLVQRRRDEA